MHPSRPVFTIAVLAALLVSERVGAQGVSGAAVSGVTVRASGTPVARATVRLLNTSSGSGREVRSDGGGRFLFENVPPGGPYHIDASAIGLPRARGPSDFQLELSERRFVTLAFPTDSARMLAPVIVDARAPTANRGSGGPAFSLSSDLVHGLPVINRDFAGLFATIPQALGRTTSSISGQSPVLNAIQIDGGTASDVYGVGRTPGSSAGAKSISLEALDEIKVLIAPFDVRQSMFTGGLINAVTRSGTNEWRAEGFTSLQRPDLVGADTAGTRARTFEFLQYGATVGGPILRDRLHLFVAVDLQKRRWPFVGPVTADPATGISDATAARAAAAFRNRYGFDAGTSAPPVLASPDQSVFAKLTWTLSPRHSVEFWHQENRAHADALNRDVRSSNNSDGWQLSGSGSTVGTSVGSSRLRVSSVLGPLANELIAGGQSSNDVRTSWLSTPLFLVQGDSSGMYLAGGSDVNGQATTLGQRIHEVTDNMTLRLGAHDLTGGAHVEWFRVTDRLFQRSWGVWTFPNVNALEAGAPTRYEIALPLRPGGPIGQFRAAEYAAYVQDRWAVSQRLSITGGVRLDVPYNSAPATNPVLAVDGALGYVNTGDFPSANAILSPRFVANWLVDERTETHLRVGAGVFTARPPFVWFGNAFINTGIDQATVVCDGNDVPAPVIDPARAPNRCLNTALQTTSSTVTYFSPGFRFPRAQKFLAGIDRQIGRSWSASVDVIHTRSVDAPYLVDTNLRQVETNAEGRAMYGSISSTGSVRPARRDSTAFTQVFRYSNRSGDRSTALSIGLAGRWDNGSRIQLGYQWSRSLDEISLTNPAANLAFQNAPIDGTIGDRRLTTSTFDAPHSLTAIGLVPLRGGVTAAVTLRAQSGRPFSYVSTGDANADGVRSNDLAYIPRTAADISLTNPKLYPALDQFIEGEPCLRSQRGHVVARNSCRNPAFATLDARVTKSFSPLRTSLADLTVDLFNLPNLLNRSWGLVRETTAKQQLGLLQVKGWDEAADRPRYAVPSVLGIETAVLPARDRVLLDESRWRIQVGARIRL